MIGLANMQKDQLNNRDDYVRQDRREVWSMLVDDNQICHCCILLLSILPLHDNLMAIVYVEPHQHYPIRLI